ncbi:MAG: hypothetical protein QOI86_5147, partial [Actinomycetota bacterium]|nr:hypothetical protein [Actinomycetota bacterium]
AAAAAADDGAPLAPVTPLPNRPSHPTKESVR